MRLKQSVASGRCEAGTGDLGLQQMSMASIDAEPAFTGADPDFLHLAGRLHGTLADAAQASPIDCRALDATSWPVLQTCHDCHQKYD